MALGAKIVAPVPKKPDPFKAFEKGDHHRGGLTVTLDLGSRPPEGDYWTSRTTVGETGKWFAAGTLTFRAGPSPAARTHADVHEAQNAVRAAVARGVSQERLRNVLKGFNVNRVTALADRDLGHFTREVSALAGASQAMDELRLQYRDQMPTLREEAIAAKMAEVQRQKQQLRALVRKDAKR